MKILTGHLTAKDKKVVKIMIDQNLKAAQSGKSNYFLSLNEGIYLLNLQKMNRGLIPVPGSKMRLSTYKSTFKL